MTDRLVTADASQVSGAQFLADVFGKRLPPRDLAAEAVFVEAMNAHYRAAKAESDAMTKRDGESALAFLIRKLAPLYAHDAYRAEQHRLWAMGEWVAPIADQREAA